MKVKSVLLIVLIALGAIACEYEKIQPPVNQDLPSPMDAYLGDEMSAKKGADVAYTITPEFLDGINQNLASKGLDYRVAVAETFTAAGSDELGITVEAKNIGKEIQLGHDFVPGDPRRPWSGSNGTQITYAIDQTLDAVPIGGILTAAQTDAAIVRGVMTWDDVSTTNLGLTRNPDGGLDIGLVAWEVSGEAVGSPFVFADVHHCGFRDLDFTGGVLGVTFTYLFIDADGFTDIDNNGKLDVAVREIYYDPSWIWADDGVSGIDVESVAVHEFGHGLSQGHFGFVFITKKGVWKFSPFAIMNAVYVKTSRELQPTDVAGHNSIWAQWPNK